jgi:hypothetical protein
MSDGMSDANALGRQERAVRDAAYDLAKALAEADGGHRGLAMSRIDMEELVNEYMADEGAPFRLRVWV